MRAEGNERYMDAAGCARYIKSTVASVRQKARLGQLPVIRLGSRVLFDRKALDRMLAEKSTEERTGDEERRQDGED